MEFVRDAANPMMTAPVRGSKVRVRSVEVNVLDRLNLFWHYLSNDSPGRENMVKRSKHSRSDPKKSSHKVTIAISDDVRNWFHDLSRMIKNRNGNAPPLSYIIRALINIFMKLDINLKDVKTEKDLKERILEAVNKYL